MTMTQKTGERRRFKDWFDPQAAKTLAKQVAPVYPQFDCRKFIRLATRDLDALEFHGRIRAFSNSLAEVLPPVPDALDILVQSLPDALPDCNSLTSAWWLWPVGHFIGEHGLGHYDKSMEAMKELTMRFTAEYPVRSYIEHFPERTMRDLLKLARHENPHVRRWCSEGCRPRLPWGRKLDALVADPSPIWPILELLKDDPEPYVRRSVSNNLNDIARNHPEMVVERCRQWLQKSEHPTKERKWVVTHGLRTLLKNGCPGALVLLGYPPPEKVKCVLKVRPCAVQLGDSVEMEVALHNGSSRVQRLMLDYVVTYVRRGGRSSSKVFKWKLVTLASGETLTLVKRHPMKVTTVRNLYAGLHTIQVQLNGKPYEVVSFDLK